MPHNALEIAAAESQKAIEFLKKEFAALQTGRASASLVEGIGIEVYGSKQPLKHVANISVGGPQELMIDPWDKSQLAAIEKAITESSLGLNPHNNGNTIILNIPPLTEERRQSIVKIVHQKAEQARVSVRQGRHAAMEAIKKDEALSEDEQKNLEKDVQKKVDEMNKEIETLSKHKEEEVMKV
jgi:ribosome recycling factor